jgi:hypothetical protein
MQMLQREGPSCSYIHPLRSFLYRTENQSKENDMRVPRIIAVFVCILFATSVAFAHKVRVDYDHSVDFSKYKTFMWAEKPQTENPLMADRIVNAVNAQLSAKGLKPVTSDADLTIKATLSIQQRQVVNTFYDGWGWGGPGWGWGWGWGWGGPGWARTYVDTYLEGTTVVDLFDTESEKAIWRGVSTGSISDKPDKASRKTVKLIAEMFESYPPLTNRISD